MQGKFQTMSDQIMERIKDMSSPTDHLEKNIVDLTTQVGVEELEGKKQDAHHTKELKVANVHWSLEHHFYKPREDQMAFWSDYYV